MHRSSGSFSFLDQVTVRDDACTSKLLEDEMSYLGLSITPSAFKTGPIIFVISFC